MLFEHTVVVVTLWYSRPGSVRLKAAYYNKIAFPKQ